MESVAYTRVRTFGSRAIAYASVVEDEDAVFGRAPKILYLGHPCEARTVEPEGALILV